ncbi:imidazole glycerol phosphate synthase subunit HisH [Clostridium estertheticum]|uniref:Imidazole glycerol phosphate synthase subunit HisH n=1 Tax=Clostridium estertheticum subsp. estertheticum TaxID=1552 RepID=A0A1J0GHM5_9CLOT|nr:imidazole glycerol phosphate synthase subunit HisH [Clostridium estertheticum]APC40464.1 imidazole glycerol phosphate synthase, glutamine amidotransferase subunit [Clostridium estertheticum subsp. estertheticum]MBU3075092.1 imidazole glycerol phosphate synthase subunit HisH [Clostridium estertheticum]MBU3165307.1 imidazole glycerol phosphate synthase subunit HisH [Clostridium estertheticum]MBU3173064.1 imidazole glycerol phosphate synthase subunit HisH [Clostridium estertheticum]MBZ9617712.
MIAIVDYGVGNLNSVQNALKSLNILSIISSNAEEISKCRSIIVPGVGAFPDAMKNMKETGIDEVIKQAAKEGKPILGICLGMQLFFDESCEVEKCQGLGLLKGNIIKLEGSIKIPHMGWNSLSFENNSPLLRGIEENQYVYFVHSYYAVNCEEGIVNAYSIYEKKIPAIVSKGNIFGMQFHPEKSGDFGMKLLKNFAEVV